MQPNLNLLSLRLFLPSWVFQMVRVIIGNKKKERMKSFTDGTTNAIAGYVESGDYDIGGPEGEQGEGEFIMRISRIMPDYGSQTGDSRITLSTKTFPNSTAVSTNYTSTTSTTQLFARARARQIAIKVGNTSTGQSWRMGTFRLDIHPGGRR